MINAEVLKEGNFAKADNAKIKIEKILEDTILISVDPMLGPSLDNKVHTNKYAIKKKNITQVHFEGIPLTEYILLNNYQIVSPDLNPFFNSSETPPSEVVYYLDVDIKLTRVSLNLWTAEYMEDEISQRRDVAFIHELQNLYFDLKGKYLDIIV